MSGRRKMALFHYLTFLAFRVLESVLAFVPLPICWLAGDWMGRASYWLLYRYRALVHRNLWLAFGDEMGKRECRRIARRHFATLGRNVVCGVKLSGMRQVSVERLVKYENRQAMLDLLEEGRGVIAASAGMGPSEFFHRAVVFGPGVASGVLHQGQSNPLLERRFTRSRERDGVQPFLSRRELSSPMQHLRNGGALGITLDGIGDGLGIWCPLFGRLTPASPLPALLSLRAGAPILPVGIYSEGIARWRICYGEPLRDFSTGGARPEDSAKVSARLTAAMEQLIRRAPEEWFWLQERWKTPETDLLLSRYGRPVEYASDMETTPLKPFRILVRSPNWLGDACMAVPAVRALKNGRPDAEVTVLCNDNLRELWEQVLHVDQVLVKPKKASVFRVAGSISREGPWNAGVLFPNSLRSALEMKLGGVKLAIGYGGWGRAFLLDRTIAENKLPGPPEHHARRYVRLAEAMGADGTGAGLFAPRDHQPPAGGRRRIGLCPGAAYGDAKRWPVERFARVVERLHERLESQVDWVIYGAPRELNIATSLQQACSVPMENLVGRTTLSELIEDLKKAHALITNDTGTMHLAALLGVRTVAIFGSTEPALTAPLGQGHEVLRVHVDCSPCFLRECPRDFRCMSAIREDDVVQAALRLLSSQGA